MAQNFNLHFIITFPVFLLSSCSTLCNFLHYNNKRKKEAEEKTNFFPYHEEWRQRKKQVECQCTNAFYYFCITKDDDVIERMCISHLIILKFILQYPF